MSSNDTLNRLAAVIESRKAEHGGDPESIDLFYRVGLDYVSCSPFRVPIARLAVAQAVLASGGKKKSDTK